MSAPFEAGQGARFKLEGLKPDVHLAFADGRVVVLDVENDRYLRIDRTRSLAAGEALADPAFADVWAALHARGLARNRASGGGVSPWRLALGEQALSPLCAASVFGSCLWAARTLRRMRFAQVLRAVQFRSHSDAEPSELHRVAKSFLAHRPFYPRDYACMFEALALLRHLAVRGLRATWMFGVRGAPFSAHCWLEHDGIVLNDDPDVVRAYTPIMGA